MSNINEIYRLAKNSLIETTLSLKNNPIKKIKEEGERILSIARKSNKNDLYHLSNYEIFNLFMMLANYQLSYYDELEEILEEQKGNINRWNLTNQGPIIAEFLNRELDTDASNEQELLRLMLSLNFSNALTQYYIRMPLNSMYIFLNFKKQIQTLIKNTNPRTSQNVISQAERNIYTKTGMYKLMQALSECLKTEVHNQDKYCENMSSRITVTKELLDLIEGEQLGDIVSVPDDWHRYLDPRVLEELYNLIHQNLLKRYNSLEQKENSINSSINSSELRSYLFTKNLDYLSLPESVRLRLDSIPNIIDKVKTLENLGINLNTIFTTHIAVLINFDEEKIKFISSLLKVGAIKRETIINSLPEMLIEKYETLQINYQILKDIIDFYNMFYKDAILFTNSHKLRNILSVLKEYTLTKNNYMFLLCNYNYLPIYDLILENGISEELLISICHTPNPLDTIKRIIIFKSIDEDYETKNHRLKRDVVSNSKFDDSLDSYLDNIVPFIIPEDINGQKIDKVTSKDIVTTLDSKYRHKDVYIIGTVKISRNKFLRNYELKQDSSYLIHCMISGSILNSSDYTSLYNELNSSKVLKK